VVPAVFLPHQAHHADHAIARAEGHADEGAAGRAPVHARGEAGVLLHALDDDGVTERGHRARNALAESDLGRLGNLVGQASRGGRAEDPLLRFEEHDRAGTSVNRAHGGVQKGRQETLDLRTARGQLDQLIEGAELEDEIFEPLRGGAEIVEHLLDGTGQLPDLGDMTQSRHPLRLAHGDRAGLSGRDLDFHGQPGDLVHHSAKNDEAQAGDDERHERGELRFRSRDEARSRDDSHEEEQGEEGNQDEDYRGRFAKAHCTGYETGKLHRWFFLL
jgi:hypothetical protein